MLRAADLIRVAELIKLGAETARAFGEVKADGEMSRIVDAASRIEIAAEELAQVGRQMENEGSEAP